MKKVIVGVVSVLASALLMAGCNKQIVDLTYEYSWAQLKICNPYKVSLTAAAGADWEWDPFNFETDTIYDTATEVKSL